MLIWNHLIPSYMTLYGIKYRYYNDSLLWNKTCGYRNPFTVH
jgi:hypothetical protein